MSASLFKLITGDDDFLIQRRGEALFSEMGHGLEAFAIEVIDGNAQNAGDAEAIIDRFLETTQTLGLFGDQKAVWFKGINFLGDTVTGRATGTKEAVERLIQGLKSINPSSVKVLLTVYPVDRRRKEYKALGEVGAVEFLESGKDESSLIELLRKEAQSLGVQLSADSAFALAQRVHGHTRMALNELQKLAIFVGLGGLISIELVDEQVPAFGEVDFFAAAEAFFAGKLQPALRALKEHCFVHKEVRPLLSALQHRNRLLIQIKVLMEAGDLGLSAAGFGKAMLEKAQKKYGFADGEKSTLNCFSQNPWYLGKLAQGAKGLPIKKLVDWQLLFLQTFEDLLSTPDQPYVVMERLYINALS